MGILVARISYFGNEGQNSEIILTDWTRLTIKRGLDATSNTVEIRLKNGIKERLPDLTTIHKHVSTSKALSISGLNPATNKFTSGTMALKQGDIIKIWLRWADSASDVISYTDSSSHMITTSEVQEWDTVLEDNKTELILKCVDKTYEVLNKLWAQSYTDTMGFTCPTLARDVIRSATDGIPEYVMGYTPTGAYQKNATYGVDARIMSGTYAQQATLDPAATGDPPAYIEGLRKNESAYPTISMTKVWKPVYEWLKEINDIRNTNSTTEISTTIVQDRNNRFYLDELNRYHQFYPEDTVDYDITAGTDDPDGIVSDFKMTKKTFDIINMVIFNAGKDLDNVGILDYFYDETSSERKLKMKYIPMLEIGSEGNGSLRSAETSKANISVAADGVVTVLVASGTTSWGTTYTSESDYKEKFRERAIWVGKERARALTHNRGNPRWKGNISIKKGNSYVAGQLLKFTALTHGINQELVRIVDVTHQITPTAWSTQLEVEADEPKYGETT